MALSRALLFFTFIDRPDFRRLHYAAHPVGTNIAFRRSVFDEVGYFDPTLGRCGGSLLSMEEIEFCYQIERSRHQILYTPNAVVHHRVRADRLTKEWVEERASWEGVSAAVLEKKLFSPVKLLRKKFKYFIFIFGGTVGKAFFSLMANEKLAFYCHCQNILCKFYPKSRALAKAEA